MYLAYPPCYMNICVAMSNAVHSHGNCALRAHPCHIPLFSHTPQRVRRLTLQGVERNGESTAQHWIRPGKKGYRSIYTVLEGPKDLPHRQNTASSSCSVNSEVAGEKKNGSVTSENNTAKKKKRNIPKWKFVENGADQKDSKRPIIIETKVGISDSERLKRTLKLMRKVNLKMTTLEFTILYRKLESIPGKRKVLTKSFLALVEGLEHAHLIEILLRTKPELREEVYGKLRHLTRKDPSEQQTLKYRTLFDPTISDKLGFIGKIIFMDGQNSLIDSCNHLDQKMLWEK